jgi:protein O-GlcNAc transferase
MPNMDNVVWRRLHANWVNPYWGEIEHYHNFSRKRLHALLQQHGFKLAEYHIGKRYRLCMEVIAIKQG